MKTFKKLLNQSGFTLVELMVVVAIIGILSAVAIPNFKRYQAKSKTSEAKLQLAAIYTIETTAQTDYDTYTTCIGDLGYSAVTKGYYSVGFAASQAATQAAVSIASGSNFCLGSHSFEPSTTVRVANTQATDADISGAVPATGDTFLASADGIISADVGTVDVWTIDENKVLTQTIIGF